MKSNDMKLRFPSNRRVLPAYRLKYMDHCSLATVYRSPLLLTMVLLLTSGVERSTHLKKPSPVLATNNTYQTATELIVQSELCSDQAQGDLSYATNTNDMDYRSYCLDFDKSFPYADVWYKATVPSSGNLTIQTSSAEGSLVLTTVMVAYTLDGGVLTEIACDGSNGYNDFSSLELLSQTPNQDIYIMVVENGNQAGVRKDRVDSFNICAYESSPLEVSTTPKPLLSYYSNPVGNRLSVESSTNIQSLSVCDITGREVLSQTPNKKQLIVDTYSLAPAVYLLRVQTQQGSQTVKLIKR